MKVEGKGTTGPRLEAGATGRGGEPAKGMTRTTRGPGRLERGPRTLSCPSQWPLVDEVTRSSGASPIRLPEGGKWKGEDRPGRRPFTDGRYGLSAEKLSSTGLFLEKGSFKLTHFV